MAQPQLVQIKLSRFDAQPWGFRLQGGVDFASPLLVQKVNGGSLAENAGLLPGDAVIKINDVDVYNMRHKDAQDIVVRSGNNFVITVQRGGSTWRPHVTPTGAVPQPNQNSPYLQTVTKTSLAHKQQDSQHIGCGYNNAARPFTNGSGDGNVKSIVNKQYNTPVGIYSDESIAETLSAQAEVLAGGVLGVNFKKNEKEYQADKSEVLKFLREEETGHTTPAFGHSQHYQDPSQEQHYQQQPQQQQQQHQQQVYHHPVHQQQQHHHQQHQQQQQQSATRHVNAPINTPKPPSTGGLPTGQNICTECERLITGVFVRIKDKNLHVECFKCATCGTSLKNQGYYNFNNKLYCEIHAKLAAQQSPPAGTEGYVPVPIKPNTKLSANTISSALSSHGYNGVSNGNAVSSHAPVNQGYARPFGAPASAPKSPVSFPPQPQQQWGASQPAAARPATGNSYATLPRSSIGQSQDPADNLQPQYEEECYESPTAGSAFFRTDPEVEEVNRKKSLNFIWPPPNDDTHDTPTAAPLYIPPPETQHIVVKPPAKEQNAPQGQWQSHSAPALSSTMQTEMESGSDSYTSTSTTTTTTTEEYQRMYAAQVKAYQMQQMCEQSGSEFDYYTEDMEDNMRERRSAQICADSLNTPINTYRLVDMVREVTPSPVPQPSQSQKRVIFLDEPEVQEVADSNMYQIEQSSSNDQLEEEDQLVLEDRTQILESQRIFQPTPEIKFEIAPVRHIPPTKIPNPVPKEWINPMVSALTTAPEVPFHMQDCPCPKPCDCKTEFEVIAPQKSTIQQEAKPPEAPPQILQESPPTGTRFTKAMTTASEFTMQFAPPVDQEVPLPEPSQPYMPPPTEIKPYLREDYRPKSPFLSALTTAPEKPFEAQFERDVPIHLLDLPTPKAHLSLSDALCVASDREYTPLNPENATHRIEEEQKRKEQKKYEFQVLDHEQELGIEPACTPVEYYTTENSSRRTSHRQSATFAAMQAFQTPNQTVTTNTPRNSVTSLCKEADTDLEYEKYCKAKERNQKRLSFLQKKEVELSQLQNQTQNQNSQTDNTIHKPLVSTNRKESSSSFNASYTVEVNNSNKNNNNNNSYAYASHQLATIATNKFDAHDIIEETAEELEHSEVLFPPPSPLSHLKGKHTSGLHRPETIPKYQRNWTVLPTQSPIRTPEPQELRENIPLAFVDAPKSNNAKVSSDNHVHKPIAQHQQQQQQQQPQLAQPQQPRKSLTINSATSAPSASNAVAMTQRGSVEQTSSRLSSTPTVPIIIEERCGPISMAFQSLDELVPKDESQTPSRCFTPCSFTNKPAPIVPFYQTAEKLCFDECPAQHARDYDRRSASPFPDRARSPAPGPPPNPLAAIRAPRVKENELSPRMLQAGSITTGQSYLGAQQQHYESTTQAGYQSFLQKPETVQTSQVGDTRVEQRQSESQLAEQQKSQTQSKTTTQIGNTQIERRRRVTEEFEHSQTAKTIEIRTETDRRQSYGKTGFVANVARRLSGMEQEINSLSSQSQSISERAAHLSSGTVFPQLKSPEPPEKFPTKPVLPPHDEPQPQSYILSATANNNNKMIGPPPGFQQQQQRNSLSACYGTSLATAIRQQQQQQKSLSAYESTTSSIQSSLSNAVSSSLTMASASTTNQASVSSGVCPVTGTFCRPGHTCCKQQVMQTARADARSMSVSSAISNQYRPTASTGAVGFKPPQPQPQQQPQSQAFAAAPPQAPNVVARASIDIDPTNDVGSAGGAGGKGGAFGATSAPKRGRGIMNKAVAPGVRVPLCNSCQTQIRGPFITALGRIWCPEHFICVNANCRRPLQDIGFVEEKGDLYCEYCFEKYLAPSCSKCNSKIKGDCLNAIGRHFHPECFTCAHCGKIFGNTPFFLEDGNPYCEADWNELFTTKCFACGFPVEAGDRWVEALNHNYHSQCFNCTYCKQNLEGQSFYNKGGRPFCKNHAR